MACALLSDLQVRMDKDRFVIKLYVKHFTPDELSVKVNDEYVNIHGKHKQQWVGTLITE